MARSFIAPWGALPNPTHFGPTVGRPRTGAHGPRVHVVGIQSYRTSEELQNMTVFAIPPSEKDNYLDREGWQPRMFSSTQSAKLQFTPFTP